MARQIDEMAPPLLVCEPVLTETAFLLARTVRGPDAQLGLLENGALRIALQVEAHVGALRMLMRKYADRPMSLADACVVRMSELHDRHAVLMLDDDFMVYRKHGNRLLEIVHPSGGAT